MRSEPINRIAALRRFALLGIGLPGIALVVLAACGTVYLPGDERRSCADLQSEIGSNEAHMAALLTVADAAVQDDSLRPSGTLVGMTFALRSRGDVERIEARSLRLRNSYLINYALNKGC